MEQGIFEQGACTCPDPPAVLNIIISRRRGNKTMAKVPTPNTESGK